MEFGGNLRVGLRRKGLFHESHGIDRRCTAGSTTPKTPLANEILCGTPSSRISARRASVWHAQLPPREPTDRAIFVST